MMITFAKRVREKTAAANQKEKKKSDGKLSVNLNVTDEYLPSYY